MPIPEFVTVNADELPPTCPHCGGIINSLCDSAREFIVRGINANTSYDTADRIECEECDEQVAAWTTDFDRLTVAFAKG